MRKRLAARCGVALIVVTLLPLAEVSARGRQATRSRAPSSARRYSYNYSGVGFPRMEGGLTAAANRTTWLKKP